MMKKNIILAFLSMFIFKSKAQDLIGIWQEKTIEVSSGYLGTYQFFSDNSFKYNTNQYDGLRRVISIGGEYKVNNDTIILDVRYSLELFGGNISRSEINTENNSWTIDNADMRKNILNKSIRLYVILKKTEKENVIILDEQKYYKIDVDPNNY
jgi:hypothetical protein